MAPPLTVVQDEKGGREWKPAEYEDEPTYSHLVEIAKTGRARCRKCVRDNALARDAENAVSSDLASGISQDARRRV